MQIRGGSNEFILFKRHMKCKSEVPQMKFILCRRHLKCKSKVTKLNLFEETHAKFVMANGNPRTFAAKQSHYNICLISLKRLPFMNCSWKVFLSTGRTSAFGT